MADDPSRIADNPSFSKLRKEMQGMKALAKLRPLLRLAGIKIDDDLVARADELSKSLDDFSHLPDRFNDLFAERGWIAYELMNNSVMRLATELGEAGDLDGAEKTLVEHYDKKTIEDGIRALCAFEAFRKRERLARLAFCDYLEERYHGCVPLVLMILDGLVNEVHGTRGFFYKGADLTAWDSISAHSSGLQKLHEILNVGRQKTTTDPIDVPYRNGILHGQDLGFDSKLVAAKAWAALFSVREWALAVVNEQLDAPPPEPDVSLKDIAEQHKRNKQQKKHLSQWRARTEEELSAITISGELDEYDSGSPEAEVVRFLDLWKKRNFGEMAKLVPPFFQQKLSKSAGQLRNEFGDKTLEAFEIESIFDEAPPYSEIKVGVTFSADGEKHPGVVNCRVTFCDENGNPICRGSEEGSWFFWPRLVTAEEKP